MTTTAQIIQWRCGECGTATQPWDIECPNCGGPRPDRKIGGAKLLSAALSNHGNENVQNNVNNVAVHGDVHLGNYFSQLAEEFDEDDEDEEEERPRRRLRRPRSESRGFWQSFFMTAGGCLMWMSTIVMGCVLVFFAGVLYKAFFG